MKDLSETAAACKRNVSEIVTPINRINVKEKKKCDVYNSPVSYRRIDPEEKRSVGLFL